MEKKQTLREQYDAINELLKETHSQRQEFSKAAGKIDQRIKLCKICSKIMMNLSDIYFTGKYCRFVSTGKSLSKDRNVAISFDVSISTKIKMLFEDTVLKDSDMGEMQEIIDTFSPEKVKIVEITEIKPEEYSSKHSSIVVVELV